MTSSSVDPRNHSESILLTDRQFRLPNANGSRISLHNIDCLKGLDALEDGSVDVIVTSPPYNLGIDYGAYDDSIPRTDYLSWLNSVFVKLNDKLSDDGSFFLNVGSSPSSPWGPFEVVMSIRNLFSLQNVIHWIKSIYVENESYGHKQSMNVGHYKPINSNRFVNDTHEYVFHFTKSGKVAIDRLAIGVPYKDTGNITRWKEGSSGIRCRGNCWYIPYSTIKSRTLERPHPASFPPELAEMSIRLHGVSKKSTLVLDPFMGIGNTAIACARLGVNCTGFEIDPEYFSTSIRLLNELSDRRQSSSSVD